MVDELIARLKKIRDEEPDFGLAQVEVQMTGSDYYHKLTSIEGPRYTPQGDAVLTIMVGPGIRLDSR